MFNYIQWGAFQYIASVVLPFCMNLFFVIYLFIAIDFNVSPLEPVNSIPVTCGFFLYIEAMVEFICYYMSPMGMEELFGEGTNIVIIILATFSYPVYFMLKIPFIIVRLFAHFGSPAELWEKAFSDTCSSLVNLSFNYVDSCVIYVLRVLYIGIPFLIFAIIYVTLIIALSPLWYFIFSPYGLNMFGISACVTFLSSEEDTVTVEERTSRVYYFNQLIMMFMSASGIIFTSCHLALAGVHWCPIILLVFCILTFLMNISFVIAVTPEKCKQGCCSNTDL